MSKQMTRLQTNLVHQSVVFYRWHTNSCLIW